MTGQMLYGVSAVQITTDAGGPQALEADRVYLWSSGAVTVYSEGQPWRIFPAHRVLTIIGKEQG